VFSASGKEAIVMSNSGGKVALVTGADGGIGRAVAERLAGDGWTVVAGYYEDKGLAQKVVAGIETRGGRAAAARFDQRKVGEIEHLFDQAETRFGGVDAVVAVAGITILKPHAETSEDDYDALFNTNTRGTYFVMREAARRVRDGGRIVAVSSVLAAMSVAGAGAYAGSKAAIDAFARSLATELGPRRVTVNTVRPGPTQTPGLVRPPDGLEGLVEATPLGRLGEAEDVAAVVSFLVGDDSHWVSGHHVHASGGMA